MGVYVCPVCAGRGFVDAGFYWGAQNSYVTSTINTTTTCRSCNGTGVVYDRIEYKPTDYNISDDDARSYIGYCTFGDYLEWKRGQRCNKEQQ